MTEITPVPLQPLAKGSLTKLWLGVAAGLMVAGGLAYAAMPAMVQVTAEQKGSGPSPTLDDVVLINYVGTLANGTEFDRAKNAVFPLAGVVPGFTKALLQMQKGGKYKVKIPASLGYGDKATGPIPANSDLLFSIELVDFKSRAEIEQQQRQMQQMQAQQGGHGMHGAGGPPPPPPGQ